VLAGSKFYVDVRRGHTLLANILYQQPHERLHKHATLELAHHVLKAGMFKNRAKQNRMKASEQNAKFMANCSDQLTQALVSNRSMFFPNYKVSKLLLRAGANPNCQTQVFCNASPLSVVRHTGCVELANLLIQFGADVNLPATNGMSALTFAAAAGQTEIVKLLLNYSPALNQVDQNGHTPLLHAISRGHNDIARILLSCNLYSSEEQRHFAAQQALVAAATTGDIPLMEFLLENQSLQCNVNGLEPAHGESPLTAAASRGKSEVCDFLITRYNATLALRNKSEHTPLLCAVRQGEWDTAELLLNFGADIESRDQAGRTSLTLAAIGGFLGLLDVLLSRGAKISSTDREGLSALSWAALKGQGLCVKSLVDRGSDVHLMDSNGRTALDLAAFYGDAEIVELLLDAGCDLKHVDVTGMSALDRAIGSQNVAVVQCLLRRGAKIAPTSWGMAQGKNDVTTALLSKSLDDGNNLYKATDFPNASKVYERALKHVGELSPNTPVNQSLPMKMADICAHLLLGYSRCQRKLGDLPLATHSATRALALKPNWYEALYARARVLRESQHLTEALNDVLSAERSAPDHNLRDIRRLIERIKDEIRKGEYRPSRPGSASSDIGGGQRHGRLRSKSNSSNNNWQGSHSTSEMSTSYQPPPSSSSSHKLQSLSAGGLPGGLSTRRDSDDLNESMMSLSSSYHQPPASEFMHRNPPQRSNSGYWQGASTPRPRLNRSLSTEGGRPRPHHRRDYSDDAMSVTADNDHLASYYYRNDTRDASTKNCRVTDL